MPSRSCSADGHVDSAAFPQSGQNLGPANNLREMRRTDFFFSFGHQHQVHRKLAPGATKRVQRGDERRLRAFLIHGAAADHALADVGFVDQGRLKWRRRPLGGIGLLHVIHEVQTDGARSAGVERGEDAGLAVGGNLGDVGESGVTQHAHGEVAAFVHAALLGGDRGLANPLLQTLHGFVVTLLDFFLDGGEIGVVGSERVAGESESGSAGGGSLEESASVHGREDNCERARGVQHWCWGGCENWIRAPFPTTAQSQISAGWSSRWSQQELPSFARLGRVGDPSPHGHHATVPGPHVPLWYHCKAPPPYVSFNKQQRLACNRRFLPGWIARKRKFIIGSIRRGSQGTSPSSWTATAAGRAAGICRAWPGTGPEWHRCARPWKQRRASGFLR